MLAVGETASAPLASVIGVDHAARESENLIAIVESRRCGLPAQLQSILQHFHRRRLMIPHGDACHRSESRETVHEVETVSVWENAVVREFVLNDDILRPIVITRGPKPPKDILCRLMTRNLTTQFG